ncbi:MAG: hypothetical protein ACFFDY_02495 [Candidatus Thorarchaeota archaeon]
MTDIIFSKAPVRICDIGGWTDTWFYPKGAVFSIGINLCSYVRIIPNLSKIVKIFSENLNISTEIQDFNKIKYDGRLDLLKAAVKRMNIKGGVDIYIRAEAPPGCGTGTSASVAVALIAALTYYSQKDLKKGNIADLAHKLEIEELKLESGVQDQYAAAFGGLNFMEIEYPSVKITPLNINRSRLKELESQLILVYLGSRSSNLMHKAVIDSYRKGDKSTLKSLEIMKNCAYEMKEVINADSLNLIGEVMNRNWEAQKNLHPLMVNPTINKLEQIAEKFGAIGFKLNGAGGGGSATILSALGSENKLKTIIKEAGFHELPVKLNFEGVKTWKANSNNNKI